MDTTTMATVPTFTYSPLTHDCFRLLTVISIDAHNKTIICQLDHYLIDEAPEYTALSYAWGHPDYSESIVCNGRTLPITPHLRGALHHLHSLGPATKFWIDAICINQTDNAEKAIHTRSMSIVYRSAQKVLVWLGKGDNDSDNAMSYVETLTQIFAPILRDDTTQRTTFINGWLYNEDLTSSGLPDKSDSMWPALGRIYSQSWFHRLWVLQEVVLAKQVIVAFGTQHVDWSILAELAIGLRRLNLLELIGVTPANCKSIGRSFLAIKKVEIVKNMNRTTIFAAPSVFNMGRDKDVTEPVDRIYGLLGLTSSSIASQVAVDYSIEARKHWWGAYIQYGKLQLQSEGTLSLLSMAASQERPVELPSWCPNLNSPAKEPFSLGGVLGYQAGFESVADRIKPRIQMIPGSDNIQLYGFRADCVQQVLSSPSYCFDKDIAYTPQGYLALLEYESRCLKVSQEIYHSSNQIPEAHWRTLTADANFFLQSPLKPEMFEDYLRVKRLWESHRDPATAIDIGTLPGSERQAILNYSQTLEGRRTRTFFSTNGGRVGLGPCDLRVGDIICVLYGGQPLFVLRFNDDNKVAQLVGDAFVYGLMDLKSIPLSDRGEDEWMTIG